VEHSKWISCLLATLPFTIVAATAQAPTLTFTFAKYVVPREAQTGLGGINNVGVVAGTYVDKNKNTHCFTYNGSAVTTIDDPKGKDSHCGSINNHGAVVGTYSDAGGQDVGFLFQNGTFTDIVEPMGAFGTDANAINDNGDVTGSYLVDVGQVHGFLLSKGKFRTIDVPGSPATIPLGINNKREVIAVYVGSHGFASALYNGKKYLDISPPGSVQSEPLGINSSGDVSFASFVSNTKVTGALLHQGTYYAFSYPKVADTWGGGVNDKGMMVGSFQVKNMNGASSGYISTYH
jgi:probable HAF family extracellular repeat protein